ncbi:MAG: ClpXP protease specificity-enhancing factor SspB, partial [Emcibacteraceae bacterium]|nr:ClpXP protease specificity-enhancing factor SspB [Emcibacteraceae bacterium]
HPDVVIPPYLKERYEDDMTIVMQNQFWDLIVDEHHFEISLSFNRSKEHLYVPFDALLGFFDPSVDFGLHFNSEIDSDSDIEIIDEEEIKDTIAVVEQEDGDEKDNIVTLDAFRKK